ncbi:MAG: ferritin family protein [Candidatus Atribacteria bacterium]|nr:ferritin family protein [Candidatus Atribacteria bacterium]
MTIIEILEEALKIEEDDRGFYLSGMNQSRNILSKETFKKLAEDELVHIQRIREGCEMINKGEPFSYEYREGLRKSSREYFENVFAETKKQANEMITAEVKELDLIRVAMERESKSHLFYIERAKEVMEGKKKEFLDFLATEEYRHYNLLFNTGDFLTRSSEGGNRENQPPREG